MPFLKFKPKPYKQPKQRRPFIFPLDINDFLVCLGGLIICGGIALFDFWQGWAVPVAVIVLGAQIIIFGGNYKERGK